MNINTMRDWVKSAYPGYNWKTKVDNMTDEQVISIYYCLIKAKKIKGA